ncbi:MAG: hypothetical protein ILO64_06580 [Clostridia bacterium]|nr:hypothetical protein [Clostridia bacterium]MBP5657503.1 hypothetical protein [Clostridia bacterium]
MKKYISLLLAVIVFAASFAACGKTEDEPSSASPASEPVSGPDAESSGEEESAIPTLDIERKDYEGKELVFFGTWQNGDLYSEIVVNDMNGDSDYLSTSVNEAIAERNRLTEDHLGIKIREIYVYSDRMGGLAAQQLRENDMAGTLGVHVVAPSLYCLGALAGEGLFVDLNTIESLDLNKPWWDKSFNETAEVNGKLFFAQGDIGLLDFAFIPVVFYNKTLAQKYGVPDLYESVREGTWTFDAVYTYSRLCSQDLNEDGIMDYRDLMGYDGQTGDCSNWFYGSGEKIIDVQNGELVLTMYNERSAGVVEKMNKLFSDRTYYCCANDYFSVSSSPVPELTGKQFSEGRSLFFSDIILQIYLLSEMKDEFGVLPIPKYDEQQDGYHSLIGSWTGNAFAIPRVLDQSEVEFAAECLQTMCYYSTDTVRKEFVERTLKYQKTRDDESTEMLNMIFSTRGTDLGFIYNVGSHGNTSPSTSLVDLLEKTMDGSVTFTAGYEARRSAAEEDLATIAAMYAD